MSEITIRYSEIMTFLRQVKRSNACPTCDHVGEWDFIVCKDDTDSKDPHMLILYVPTQSSKGVSNGPMSYVSLECPNCGHVEFINSHRIRDAVDQAKDDDQHE